MIFYEDTRNSSVETKLYYLISRYYNSEWGRFIQSDTLDYIEPSSINGLNLYCYCLNNPIMFFDSNGNYPKPISLLVDIVTGLVELVSHIIYKQAKNYLNNPMTIKEAQKLIRKNNMNQSARSLLRNYSDDALNSLKLSESMSKFGTALGYVLVVIDVGCTIYNNYNSGSPTWVTDSLVDVGYILLQTGISALCSYFIPGVGWIIGIGINLLLDYIFEEKGLLDDAKKWLSKHNDIKKEFMVD